MDVQNNRIVFITSKSSNYVLKASNASLIGQENLIENCIFHSVKKIIKPSWINNKDQYLSPNSKWEGDDAFKYDCLIYSLFAESNIIKSELGINHWISFTREEVGCKKTFKSHFMRDFLRGIKLSESAQLVYNSTLELWKYYHSQEKAKTDTSFYDIREYFQGVSNGKMKHSSDDNAYNKLILTLREKMKLLANEIEGKVYEYGFLL